MVVSDVETKYSFGELVRRIHVSIEHLNSYIKEHDRQPPFNRILTENKIIKGMFKFQILSKKLGSAFIDLVGKNSQEISKTIVNNPAYLPHLETSFEGIDKTLRTVIDEETREIYKANYLRKKANVLRKSIKTLKNKTDVQARQSLEGYKRRQQGKTENVISMEEYKRRKALMQQQATQVQQKRAA